MPNPLLVSHYDRKYASEAVVAFSPIVPLVRVPTSRFEAAVKFIPKFFRGGDILELGLGDGRVAKTLLQNEPNIISYVVSDISRSRLEGLRRSLQDPRVRTAEIDADSIPEQQLGSFDAVIMIALIEHVVDPLRVMSQVRTLLKPGGFVYVDTPNIAKLTRRLKLLFGRFPSTASTNEGLTTYDGEPVDLYDEGHLHYFSYRSLELMLINRCNYSRIEKLGYPWRRTPLGGIAQGLLAAKWPEMFSELAMVGFR